MKLVFDLSKSLDKTKLVQVQRTVQGKHGQYQRMQWVKPSDVKDTDKVVGGQPVNKDSSDKPIKDGQTLYFKNGESISSKDGKITRTFKGGVKTEISQAEADRVIPFLTKKYGKTEAPTKSDKPYNPDKPVNIDDFKFTDYKNPDGQNTSNRKTYKSALKDWAEQTEKLYNRAMKNYWGDTPPEKQLTTEFMNLNRESSIRDLVSSSSEDGLKEARDAIYARQKKLIEMSKKYTKWDSSKREWTEGSSKESSTSKDSVPNKALGKTWSDTKTELGKMGYKVDSIFSSQPPQPKEKLILYKDGKEYEAEVTKYHNGDYEILGSSIKEVKKTDDTKDSKKNSDNSTNKPTKVRKVSNMDDLQNGIKSINRAIGKEHNIFNAVSVMGSGKLGEQLAYVSIPKLQTESNAKKVIDEQLKREFGDSVKYSLTKESDHFVVKLKLDDNKTSNTSTGKAVDQPNSDKPTIGSKFDASEFTKLKSDRTKAIQYLKDSGISWKETDNEGINWMRACMAASRVENPAQGATKKDSANKSSSDTKASGKSTEEAKKAVKDLLSANNNDRAKVMQIAKASGVTWKESDNDGINWMRASLAIQKHHESGKTISVSDSDDKKDDTKTDDKPSAKKVSISDLKRPASNNTSTNLVAGDYIISVTKLRNVGANAKQHPSFYRIIVEKDGDRVFYTDKTDWSDIKEHAKRYIDTASKS